MQSRTDESVAGLEAIGTREGWPRSFELFEEYSRCGILETIRERRDRYNRASKIIWERLEAEVEEEIEGFRIWLEETKNLEPTFAHYCSVGLKSMLLGLPVGVQVAQLFDIAMDKRVNNTH